VDPYLAGKVTITLIILPLAGNRQIDGSRENSLLTAWCLVLEAYPFALSNPCLCVFLSVADAW